MYKYDSNKVVELTMQNSFKMYYLY